MTDNIMIYFIKDGFTKPPIFLALWMWLWTLHLHSQHFLESMDVKRIILLILFIYFYKLVLFLSFVSFPGWGSSSQTPPEGVLIY